MSFDDQFASIWKQVTDLEVQDTSNDLCIYSSRFGAWVEELVAGIHKPNIALVNQAKILILDKYFEWYRFVPRSHRLRLGSQGHLCIFQVFEQGYERLKILELALTPPLLFLPDNEPPEIPPSPIIGGIFIGEDARRLADENKSEDE